MCTVPLRRDDSLSSGPDAGDFQHLETGASLPGALFVGKSSGSPVSARAVVIWDAGQLWT